MTQTFEEYLMEYVCRTEPCTDDLLPEIYADWLEQVEVELIIELAEKWHKEQSKQQYLQGAKDLWGVLTKGSAFYQNTKNLILEQYRRYQQFINNLEVTNE